MDQDLKADRRDWARMRDALVARRIELGLSQRAVARGMGVGQPHICELERADRVGYFSTWQRYARAVGCRLTIHIELEESDA